MSELYHYASEYYDPIKAHEYYEAHKKLKGRSKTADLTEEGKRVEEYVKYSLGEERKKLITSKREQTKSEINAHVSKTQYEIAKLRILLDSNSLKDNPVKKNQVVSKIKMLISENNAKKMELLGKFKREVTDIEKEYSGKYESELEKIQKEFSIKKEVPVPSTSSNRTVSAVSVPSEPSEPSGSSESSEPKPKAKKKEQTSKWARHREKRREKERKKLLHSDDLAEVDNQTINGKQMANRIMMEANDSDIRISDLQLFGQDL